MKGSLINATKHTAFWLIACLLCLFLLFTGCSNSTREEYQSPTAISTGEYDIEPKGHEDTILNATNIVTAKFLETAQSFRGNEYVYEVEEELKGSIDCDTFFLITVEYVEASSAMPVTGENAILFLSKYSSVYNEHDNYILMDIAEDTESERHLITNLSSKSESPNSKSGHVFTRSENFADILAVTDSIFYVTPEEVYASGTTAPTTTYTCTVQASILGQPEFSEILITFFNNTVKVGEQYLVLLADHHEGGRIYTLSSPYSVLTMDEALEIPEVRPLLEKIQDITAPNLPTEDEIYAGEQSSLVTTP